MAVRVFGCNHIAIEVDDSEKTIEFYTEVFNLKLQEAGEGDVFFALGNHQFLAIFDNN
ncbi:MAG TPA: VOC family protein [Candidatus Handelsmanbacteria bacterium]|nr:VOC family protein [Candidatus Handelsmanbacteria bacterium]